MLTANLKNNRQIPKVKDICANKKYYDVLYSYLQCISFRDESNMKRLIEKEEINYTKIGTKLNLTRQTVATKFKNLLNLGLIQEYNDNYFEIITLEKEIASLIPYDTLCKLTDTLNEKTISTYVYLLNRYYANDCQSFQFTLDQIKVHIGISTKTTSNNEIITNILYILQKLGLIKYRLVMTHNKDIFTNIKTVYQLEDLSNVI